MLKTLHILLLLRTCLFNHAIKAVVWLYHQACVAMEKEERMKELLEEEADVVNV